MKPEYEKFYKRVGKKIAYARIKQGSTPAELSAALGVCTSQLANYENGRCKIPHHIIILVREALGRDCFD